MRVDVTHVVGSDFCVAHGRERHAISAIAAFGWLRDVVGVAGHAVADNFGDNFRAAALRVFERFED